jgi:hypothetical protein
MFPLSEILPDVERVLGVGDLPTVLSRVNAAVEILCTESDWDPTVAYVDVAVGTDRCLTLPRQVESILAVNIGGRPSLGHDRWFQYHLNGPGNDCRLRDDSWTDLGPVVTVSDPILPFQLSLTLEDEDDAGTTVRVYGYDSEDKKLVTTVDGVTTDGVEVGTALSTTMFKRITRITKPATVGFVRLTATLEDDTTELIGLYEPSETEPQYRRLLLGQQCTWARIQFKKRVFKLTSASDFIPLHSPYAVVLMCKALKKFDEDRLDDGNAYQAKAIQLLTKKQLSVSPPTGPSIQVADRNLIADKTDRIDW